MIDQYRQAGTLENLRALIGTGTKVLNQYSKFLCEIVSIDQYEIILTKDSSGYLSYWASPSTFYLSP
jgi:hypothetical protein